MHTLALPPKQMLSSPPLFRHLHLHPPQKLQPQTTSYPSLHLSSSPPLPSHHTTTNRSLTACFCYSSVSSNTSTSPLSSSSEADDFDVELGRLLALLPEEMRRKASEHPELHHLIEVVMDLGRKPLARFPSGDFVLSDDPITSPDLQQAMSQVGDFALDNRAGISRTLHRISAIKNRKGSIIGLTCRVGRAITGSANLLRDLVKDGSSLLLIGPPGVGKTTIIREVARLIADDYKKRVMIVDTSNEIGGDGDIPHAGIGSARRMQVPNSDMQHKVLIEAVENHMPQVIVIDEIGTKLEAMAASTIAQRGIQLVATAHGVTIENLIMNPSLEMLVGGIQSVTLGDEEASRRGGQKTVLERKGPSTFTCGVEIISKAELRVHRSLEETVDALLSGRSLNFEVRKMSTPGLSYEMLALERESSSTPFEMPDELIIKNVEMYEGITSNGESSAGFTQGMDEISSKHEVPFHLYVYGILETSVMQGIRQLEVHGAVEITDNISEADGLLALQSKLKKNSRIQAVAKSRDIPVYVTKTCSLVQITKAIDALLSDHVNRKKAIEAEDRTSPSEKIDALEEARLAIEQVVIPKGMPVDLLPRSSHIMSLQMGLIRKYQLQSEKVGKEADIRLRILPLHTGGDEGRQVGEVTDEDGSCGDSDTSGDINGSIYRMDRLPLLLD